ncbi:MULTISPECIES: GNAT family N-acetyltransferase [Micrococcaceae]|nr:MULTISPECIES: GNAT family N-acetyltransferase [Micrococcaceae]ABM10320.1 acetyltransferase, GNAT family protein [Paenarthrobacter aurescens TC1]SDQ03388.1 Acetyltransferase (GNAT) family protein [Arthrobacter crystallopoietes]
MTAPILPRVRVRPATRGDLALTASWQCTFLPHGLFPRMGEQFVRCWHATYLDAPYGTALVAELRVPGRTPTPVGFLVGATDQVRHVDDVLGRHRARLGIAGAKALALRPRLAAHFLRTRAKTYLRRLLRGPSLAAPAGDMSDPARAGCAAGRPQTAVITAVAVIPGARGSGAGKELVRHFLAQAHARGAARAELAVIAGTGSADGFYTRLGWQPVEEHLSKDGSLTTTYRYDFGTGAAE